MATAQDIINRALRLCKVLDAGSAATAEDAADSFDVLNAMLAEWHFAEIGLPDYSFASLTDTLASDAADREAIAYQLAIRMAPEYDAELSPYALALADETMSRMRMRYFQPGTAASDLPGRRYGYDIEAG